jgi:formiminotetrahydrofolate cyclodeaminase
MEDLENGVHSMASGMTDSPMKKTLYDMRFTKDDKQSVKDEMNSIGDDLQSAKDEIAEGINNDYSSIKST